MNDISDLEHLKWIYERMVNIHGENINVDYMIRFKKILIQMDLDASILTREHVITWCKQLKNLPGWPQSTKFPAPDGWEWFVSHKPYQLPSYQLRSLKTDERICKEDVYK